MPRLLTELIAREGAREIARYSVEPGEYSLGASAECSVFLDAEGVLPEHARLTVAEDGSITLEALGEGVTVAGEPVAGSAAVQPEQAIGIGPVQIVLQQQASSSGGSGVSLGDEEHDGLPGEFHRERYEIGAEIAKGGMGAILKARQSTIRRAVAMKVILGAAESDPRSRLRFIEEAQITGQLEHPNIVPVHDCGVDAEGRVFYTMKLVQGITLKKILELLGKGTAGTVEKYSLPSLLTIFQKVCDAVAFAHSKGVIHRDLKPANIMVGSFGEVLVMDWGLAKLFGRKEETAATPQHPAGRLVESARAEEGDIYATMEGSIVGTLAYMAPEQARGEVDKLDPRTDIFALGAILYEILTLERPYPAKTTRALLESILGAEPPIAPARRRPATDEKGKPLKQRLHLPGQEVPESLSAVAMRALAAAAEERYESVKALQAELTAYQNGFATRAEKAGSWRQLKLWVKRNKAAALGLAAVLLVGGIFGTRAVLEGRRAERVLAELRGTAPTFHTQGVALLYAGDFAEAMAKLDFAVKLDPANPEYRLQRAHLLQSTERLREAAAEYRQVLAQRRGDPSAALNLKICEELAPGQGDQSTLSTNAQHQLLDALLAQRRNHEAAPLSRALRRESQTHEAAILARLGAFTVQKGWHGARLRSTPEGFELHLGDLAVGDLPNLKGLPISKLNLDSTLVRDLRPLAGLQLRSLSAFNCGISDLSSLQGMPIRELHFPQNAISDLSPLRGMPLEKLNLNQGKFTDLSPLAGAPLKNLDLSTNRSLADLAPLAGSPIEKLVLIRTGVEDLTPLRGLPLRELNLSEDSNVRDFTPLRAHPTLEKLNVPYNTRGDVSVLATLPKLQSIEFHQGNAVDCWFPAAEFIARYGWQAPAIKAAREALSASGVKDLEIWRTQVDAAGLLTLDLSGVQGVRLPSLAPLPIKVLQLAGTLRDDVSPLTACGELESLCVPMEAKNLEALRALPKLRYLSAKWDREALRASQTVEEFWKEFEARKRAGK